MVFIDSTWRQTKSILSDPRVKRLTNKSIVLSTHDSLFWRHQRNTPRTYLSTIEAIYYFFVDLHKILDEKRNNRPKNCGQYDHRYDNLLFFFKHTYNRLRQKYNIWTLGTKYHNYHNLSVGLISSIALKWDFHLNTSLEPLFKWRHLLIKHLIKIRILWKTMNLRLNLFVRLNSYSLVWSSLSRH